MHRCATVAVYRHPQVPADKRGLPITFVGPRLSTRLVLCLHCGLLASDHPRTDVPSGCATYATVAMVARRTSCKMASVVGIVFVSR